MDDFLFDPWSADRAGDDSPSPETTEGKEVATEATDEDAAAPALTGEAAPAAEVAPAAAREPTEPAVTTEVEARPDPRSPRRWRVRSGPTEAPMKPSPRAPTPTPPAAPQPAPRPFHSIPEHPRFPGEGEPSSRAKRLRSIALPRIEEMATRLRAARHRTLLDDRLDRSEPVLRFRLIPWEGPFDEAPTVPGSVLELAPTARDKVTARYWVDPSAEDPEGEVLVTMDALDGSWLEGVLVDFVAKALKRG